MKKKYNTEPEGQQDFYEELGIVPDYSCNTDGRIEGTLVEFKLNIREIPLKQLKRYIESYNAVALPLPRYSLFININQKEFAFIDNKNWKIITDGKWENPKDLMKFLDKKEYIKGWINEYSIVSYNDLFYKGKDATDKQLFIEEIKNPKELNIKPYHWIETGVLATDLLDCLGGKALKKRLGAFFTPDEYVKISTEYFRNAIKRIPEGYDYIILDRCAGTGNLEKFLTNKELSHCVLNTYVYAEWTTLKGLYEDRARYIIPHTKDNKDVDGLLSDGDALTEEFDKVIRKIIDKERKKANGKLVVIGLENPPYSEPQAEATRKNGQTWKQSSWVKEQMKKKKLGISSNDLSNQFIFSMFKYANEYIVYAPIKYWKSQHLLDSNFNEGYLCNRKSFHSTEAGISLISWTKGNAENNVLDVDSDLGKRKLKKVENVLTSINPPNTKNKFVNLYHVSGTPDFKHGRIANYTCNIHCKEIGIGNSNIFQALPLFVANCYKPKDYTEKEVIMKSGDGGIKYQSDKDFLMDCFVWACLSNANKCISKKGLKNELCLNQNTKADKLLIINNRNTKLLQEWREILKLIKTTEEYNSKFTYGLHQIIKDINVKVEIGRNKKNEPIMEHKYGKLNNKIKDFKEQLKEFYDKYLTSKLFKYELLK